MALLAYRHAKGAEVGQHPGFGHAEGARGLGSIGVIAYHHRVVSPREPQSGLSTGQWMHKPFTVVKVTDKATPALYSALCTNENLTEISVDF